MTDEMLRRLVAQLIDECPPSPLSNKIEELLRDEDRG